MAMVDGRRLRRRRLMSGDTWPMLMPSAAVLAGHTGCPISGNDAYGGCEPWVSDDRSLPCWQANTAADEVRYES